MSWDPEQYHRFRAERSQPFYDLLAMVEGVPGACVVDLGCGTGELTALLHERLGAAQTVGVDNSDAMLATAAQHAGNGLEFVGGDIATWAPDGPVDVVFSNAALQWVPDHGRLLRRLRGYLAPGGQLAVQVPANFDHPSHVVAAAVAQEEPFQGALGAGTRGIGVEAPEWYASLVHELGFERQEVRMQVYGHLLQDREAVIEWVKGTLLTSYRSRLAPELYERFLAHYRERLLPMLADDHPYFYPFKRILLWGRLPS